MRSPVHKSTSASTATSTSTTTSASSSTSTTTSIKSGSKPNPTPRPPDPPEGGGNGHGHGENEDHSVHRTPSKMRKRLIHHELEATSLRVKESSSSAEVGGGGWHEDEQRHEQRQEKKLPIPGLGLPFWLDGGPGGGKVVLVIRIDDDRYQFPSQSYRRTSSSFLTTMTNKWLMDFGCRSYPARSKEGNVIGSWKRPWPCRRLLFPPLLLLLQ